MGVWNDQLIPATSATENGNCGNPMLPPPKPGGGRSPTRDGRSSTHPLPAAHRLLLEDAAPGAPAAVAHCVPLLPHLASGRNLAAGPRHAARHASGSGPGAQPQRGHHRQPVGKDHGKRGPRGSPGKVKGRKRHIVVDTLGLLLAWRCIRLTFSDRDGARLVLRRLMGRFPRLGQLISDGAYGGKLVAWAQQWPVGDWLVRLHRQQHTFQVLPRRWVVERTWRAEPAAAIEQGLRGIVRNHGNLDLHLHDRPHATPTGPPSLFLDTLLDTRPAR